MHLVSAREMKFDKFVKLKIDYQSGLREQKPGLNLIKSDSLRARDFSVAMGDGREWLASRAWMDWRQPQK